jgi:hypothetical protein
LEKAKIEMDKQPKINQTSKNVMEIMQLPFAKPLKTKAKSTTELMEKMKNKSPSKRLNRNSNILNELSTIYCGTAESVSGTSKGIDFNSFTDSINCISEESTPNKKSDEGLGSPNYK